jgi:hypothetical protein
MASQKNSFGTLVSSSLGCLAGAAILSGCNAQQFSLPGSANSFAETATYTHSVDILWVIDNSGSMGTGTATVPSRQQMLSSQVGLFINGLNQTGLDYQMGVTTMDMSPTGPDGRFIYQTGTPVLMNSATSNLLTDLAGRIGASPGGGSPVARGMDSVIALTSAPLINGPNAGFLRPNSLLVLIFLTDENDASSANPSNDVAYLNALRPPFLQGDTGWVANYMGVMPNDPNCTTSAWQYSSPGTRYINLATASGGDSESICSGDLTSALTGVTSRILEVTTAYPLNGAPDPTTIVVTVNGVIVPQAAINGWTYDSTDNTIRFNGTAIPVIGSSINVTFNPAHL